MMSAGPACGPTVTPAITGWNEVAASMPTDWLWAVTFMVIVGMVVTGSIVQKWMANRLTSQIVSDYGPGCLVELTRHHEASSLPGVAVVLQSAADMARAFTATPKDS
jgi:hypothetical protein